MNKTSHTYPIVPELTCGRISVLRSFQACCGFQIKVMINVGDTEPSLQREDLYIHSKSTSTNSKFSNSILSSFFVVGSPEIFDIRFLT